MSIQLEIKALDDILCKSLEEEIIQAEESWILTHSVWTKRDPVTRLLVASDNASIHGFALLTTDFGNKNIIGYIYFLFIIPRFRRLGTASKIVARARDLYPGISAKCRDDWDTIHFWIMQGATLRRSLYDNYFSIALTNVPNKKVYTQICIKFKGEAQRKKFILKSIFDLPLDELYTEIRMWEIDKVCPVAEGVLQSTGTEK